MSTSRVRQMAHPITQMKFRLPSGRFHQKNYVKPKYSQLKLSEGKFFLRDPFRERPDWTYTDGRPSPLNVSQLESKMEQIELAKSIVNGLKEIKAAEKEHLVYLKQQRESIHAMEQSKPRAKGPDHPKAFSRTST